MAKFNEDTRVKIPATIQFLRLGYEYQSLKDIDLHTETRIAINRFKPAIERINGRSFSNEEIQAIIADILSVIKNNDLGKAFYKWLINPQDRVKLIDFDCIENNDFAVVDELTFGKEGTESEKEGSFRPDITVLINGIPLAFLEVKHPNNEGGIQAELRSLPLVGHFRQKLLELKEQQKENKRVCGNCYSYDYDGYIFVDAMGTIFNPNAVTENFSKILKRNGLRHIRFHDLRHSCASLLLANDVPMKQIQEWLGHSDISTTANIYSHLDYKSKITSANVMDNVLALLDTKSQGW